MKLGKIVLKLRLAETRFGNLIGGAAELSAAISNTLLKEMAFVIPLTEDCGENEVEQGINQQIRERFGVVVAIRNDTNFVDKVGLAAYDSLYDVRGEIFKAILGWQIKEAESNIYYRGGKLVGFNSSYLYYQYEFEYTSRLADTGEGDGRDVTIKLNDVDEDENNVPVTFEQIYAYIILAPSSRLDEGVELPLTDIFPDIAQAIDMTKDPGAGGFTKGFSSGFNFYHSEFTR